MTRNDIEKLDPQDYIIVAGARLHNLKNVAVAIPRDQFVVITGLSGSGKSSLAFDTIYAEGQRRYVESLSSYARQFLGRLNKPEVDYIKGLAPAVAIEQKVNTKNPRSTVGTSTEIYDYLKLLFARIGETISPISGEKVQRDTPTSVTEELVARGNEHSYYIACPIALPDGRRAADQLSILQQQGFSRILRGAEVLKISELLDRGGEWANDDLLLIDRIRMDVADEDLITRLTDSIQTAFYEGHGSCTLIDLETGEALTYSDRFERDGLTFDEPSEALFAFNNPFGACPQCEGYGSIIGIDEDLVIPHRHLSIYDGAIHCWNGNKMSEYRDALVMNAYKFDFPIHTPYRELTEEQRDLIWNGNNYFVGINDFFEYLEKKAYKIQNRVILARYRGKTKCTTCGGKRLRKEAGYVKIGAFSILDLIDRPLEELQTLFADLRLTAHQEKISARIRVEIESRLDFLIRVGLGYLTLNRRSSTLSGGESQRIQLGTALGSSLVGSMYILDEPSIGLHSRDTERLIGVLRDLRDLGNTVIVVEHDEDIIRAADYIIDLGPEAGALGGELVFAGSLADLMQRGNTLTAGYLSGDLKIPITHETVRPNHAITIENARANNLQGISVHLPIGGLSVVTGVSGSGKSTLIRSILAPAVRRQLGYGGDKPGDHDAVHFPKGAFTDVEMIDQSPMGKSSRSNPVTYIKAYDEIRNLYAAQKLSKTRNYKSKHFSFNVPGGRCETCQGDGTVTIEMQFLADVQIPCEDCGGKRFKEEILEVKFHDRSIHDILELTIDEAIDFFHEHDAAKIAQKLQPLHDVGLGYVHLGQSSSTLSGGEAQRVKLASYLSKGTGQDRLLFIFDEPTTGLHFHDVQKLLKAFRALQELGHTLVVIEHQMDVAANADWIIDLGPEGGSRGGRLMYEGPVHGLLDVPESATAPFLRGKLQ